MIDTTWDNYKPYLRNNLMKQRTIKLADVRAVLDYLVSGLQSSWENTVKCGQCAGKGQIEFIQLGNF